MPPEATVSVVVDRHDDPAVCAELSRRADPTTGVVVVRPVPGITKPAELAADVLISLGKRFDALTREKKRPHGWRLAQLWIQAEKAKHLVIVDADRLPAQLWATIAGVRRATQAHVWMLGSATPKSDQADAVGDHQCVNTNELLDVLPEPQAPPPANGDIEGPLPADDFLTFRASCRDLLPAPRFDTVDRVYRAANTEVFAAIGRLTMTTLQKPELITGVFQQLAGTSNGPGETVIRFRAAQAAFFARGLLVNLVPALHPPNPVHTVGLTGETAARLRRLVSPELVTACAISAAHPHLDQTKLTVAAIGEGGTAIHTRGTTVPIPDYGHALIEIQRLQRLASGAKPPDPLFINGAGNAAGPALIQRKIDTASDLAAVVDAHDPLAPAWHTTGVRRWTVQVTDAWPVPGDIDDHLPANQPR